MCLKWGWPKTFVWYYIHIFIYLFIYEQVRAHFEEAKVHLNIATPVILEVFALSVFVRSIFVVIYYSRFQEAVTIGCSKKIRSN